MRRCDAGQEIYKAYLQARGTDAEGDAWQAYCAHAFHCEKCSGKSGHAGAVTQPLPVTQVRTEKDGANRAKDKTDG